MAIYMLFDNPADKQNMTFLKEYETAVIQHVYPEQKCNSTKEMLSVCKEIIKKSADGHNHLLVRFHGGSVLVAVQGTVQKAKDYHREYPA